MAAKLFILSQHRHIFLYFHQLDFDTLKVSDSCCKNTLTFFDLQEDSWDDWHFYMLQTIIQIELDLQKGQKCQYRSEMRRWMYTNILRGTEKKNQQDIF